MLEPIRWKHPRHFNPEIGGLRFQRFRNHISKAVHGKGKILLIPQDFQEIFFSFRKLARSLLYIFVVQLRATPSH